MNKDLDNLQYNEYIGDDLDWVTVGHTCQNNQIPLLPVTLSHK